MKWITCIFKGHKRIFKTDVFINPFGLKYHKSYWECDRCKKKSKKSHFKYIEER